MKAHIAKKKVAKKYFDKWALDYDESILQHLVFRSAHNMLYHEIVSYKNGMGAIRILDVGCGTGEFVQKLARLMPASEIHGLDLSRTMIDKARGKTRYPNLRFDEGDVEKLPYEDNSFDVITCSHSFHHYPDKEEAVREMYRVLKTGGRLMIVDGCRDTFFGRIIFNIVERMEKHVYHLLGDEFRELFRKTGFNNIVQKRFNAVPLLLTIGAAIKDSEKVSFRFASEAEELVSVIPACESGEAGRTMPESGPRFRDGASRRPE